MSEPTVEIGDLEARSSEQKLTSICDTVPDSTGKLHVFAVIDDSRESSNKGSLGRGNTCVAAVNTEDIQHMDISTLIERLVPVRDWTPHNSFVMEQAKDPAVCELLEFIERGCLPEDNH